MRDPGAGKSFSLLTGVLRFSEIASDRLSGAKVWPKMLQCVYTWNRTEWACENCAGTSPGIFAGWRKGERLQVTERDKPVAVLGPVDESASALRRLVASGRATPPEGDLLDLAPPKGAGHYEWHRRPPGDPRGPRVVRGREAPVPRLLGHREARRTRARDESPSRAPSILARPGVECGGSDRGGTGRETDRRWRRQESAERPLENRARGPRRARRRGRGRARPARAQDPRRHPSRDGDLPRRRPRSALRLRRSSRRRCRREDHRRARSCLSRKTRSWVSGQPGT